MEIIYVLFQNVLPFVLIDYNVCVINLDIQSNNTIIMKIINIMYITIIYTMEIKKIIIIIKLL